MQTKIFGIKGGNNRRFAEMHNEELHDLYCSSDISGVNKSRRMAWRGMGHADGSVSRLEEIIE